MKKQFVADRRDTEEDKKKKSTADFNKEYTIEDNDVFTDMQGHREYLEKYVYFDKLTKNKKQGISKGDPLYKEFSEAICQYEPLSLKEKV
jgi:hypothetical protein